MEGKAAGRSLQLSPCFGFQSKQGILLPFASSVHRLLFQRNGSIKGEDPERSTISTVTFVCFLLSFISPLHADMWRKATKVLRTESPGFGLEAAP